MIKITRYIAIIATALMAVSCSGHDEPENIDTADDCGYIMFGSRQQAGTVSWTASETSRDAATEELEGVMPLSVGVFGYNDVVGGQSYTGAGEVFNNVEVYYRKGDKYDATLIPEWFNNPDGTENLWPYVKPMPWLTAGTKYKFMAYAPYISNGQQINVPGRSYGGFNGIEWLHVPKYSADDYMVSDRIVQYTAHNGVNDVQKIQLQHMQARLRLCFKLGDRFSKLRMVRVKQIELTNLQGFLYTVRVEYSPGERDGAEGLYPSCTWGIEDRTATQPNQVLQNEIVNIDGVYTPQSYIELNRYNNTYTPLASVYVYPGDDLSALSFKITYDVYDFYDGHEPVLLRENDTATNVVQLNYKGFGSTASGSPILRPGYYYDIKMTIEPTYLYVLSDNDFDADGYFIVSDK